MVDIKSGSTYTVEPMVITEVATRLQDTLKEMSLSVQRIPTERTLSPITKNYEWRIKDYDTGIDIGMSANQEAGVSESLTKTEKRTPLVWFNKKLDYDTYLEESQSAYSLRERLQDHMGQMALRIDIYNYRGVSKYSIPSLDAGGVGTVSSSVLNTTSTALASTSMAANVKQLKQQLKYTGLIGPNSNIIVEFSPSAFETLSTKSTNEDFNAQQAMMMELQRHFPGGNHQIVENWLLGTPTINIPNDSKVHSITYGTTDYYIMYVQDPRIMRNVQSNMEVRQSPLDPTSGIVMQPVIRNRRIDEQDAGVIYGTPTTS